MISFSFQFTNLMASAYTLLFGGLIFLKISGKEFETRKRFWIYLLLLTYTTGLFKIFNTPCKIFDACNYISKGAPFLAIFYVVAAGLLAKKGTKTDKESKVSLLFSCNLLINAFLIYFKNIYLTIFELIFIHITIIYLLKYFYYFKKKYVIFMYSSIIFLMMSLITYFIILKLEKNYLQNKIIKIHSRLKLIHSKISDYERTGSSLCKIISTLPEIKEMALSRNKNRWFLKLLKQMCGVSYIWIMDKSGTITVCSDPKYEEYNYAFRPYFKKALKGIANVYYARGVRSNTVGAFFARPIIVKGKICAVLAIKFNFSLVLGSSFQQERMLFVHKSGAVLFGPEDLTDVSLYNSSQDIPEDLRQEKVFGQKETLRPAGYKLVKDNLLQDKEGRLWYLISIPLSQHGWQLAKLYNLKPIFQYRLLLLSIYTLLFLVYGFLILRIFQNREFIFRLEKEITERKKLQKSQMLLATAVEQVAESIVITDSKGIIEYVNPAFTRLSGYTKKEALGKTPRILKSGKHNPSFYKQLWATITKGKHWYGHFINKKKDGTLYEEEASISPIKDSTGKIVNYVAVKRDITKENELKEQLLQAQKMESIGILAGGVAHDFNNLLLAMQGYVEISMRKLENTHPVYKNLAKVHSTISKAADLVRQLLLFSRKQPMNFTSINLNEIVSNMAKMLQRLIGENISIRLDLQSDLWSIQADTGKIEQIIVNLAVNAKDAMPQGGELNIKTENVHINNELLSCIPNSRQGQFVCLSIADTGAGMDKQTLTHIFEPFFTTKEAGKGTGLGLPVVYGIVKEHKGWINVDSEKDKGTVFKIYLPAQFHAKNLNKQENQSFALNLQGEKERILLIEDEEDVRDVVATVLMDNGYTVIEAGTAMEALDIFNREKVKFDLVLSDMVLPDQNGLKLVEQLLSKDPEITVILSSGYTDYSSHMPVIQKKGFLFLQKPYSIDALLLLIKQALDQKRKKTEN